MRVAEQSNVVTFVPMARRAKSSLQPKLNLDVDGSYRTGEIHLRDRWFGIPAVDEKVIDRRGKVCWRRVRPPPHPMNPVRTASYVVGPTVWLAAILGLWWLL